MRSRRSTAAALVFLATFTDLLAYSVGVPILPDLSARLGASPAMIGVLFGSFGLTMLATSIPMGALSDRIGRRLPMVLGLVAIGASSVGFAFADRLVTLFAARMILGVADAMTWVVGLALVAELYGPSERGRVMGLVMSGPGLALTLGPTIGGFLYEAGGVRLPFLCVAALSAVVLCGFLWLVLPARALSAEPATLGDALRTPAIIRCVVVVIAAAGTIAMLEPVVVLQLAGRGIGPARAGTLFGFAAIVTAVCNPLFGRITDRVGAWRMMMLGLVLASAVLPFLGRAGTFAGATVCYALEAAAIGLVITPSLSFMADASAEVSRGSFGLSYGLYNVAWGIGLLAGPSLGGVLFERIGFAALTTWWAPALLATAAALAYSSPRSASTRPRSPASPTAARS